MNEDFNSRAWADNHEVMSNGLANLFDRVRDGFVRLQARQFAVPWKTQSTRRPC